MFQDCSGIVQLFQEKLTELTMTDPERSKGRKKGSTEVTKKGKKVQSDNTVNEQEAPDTLICNRCKGIFTNVNAKMIYCEMPEMVLHQMCEHN